MAKPERFIFVCINERPPEDKRGSCGGRGGGEVFSTFKELLGEKGIYRTNKLIKTGCLKSCSFGPNVAIFPDNCWYKGVQAQDVNEIIEEHLISGRVVNRLLRSDGEWK